MEGKVKIDQLQLNNFRRQKAKENTRFENHKLDTIKNICLLCITLTEIISLEEIGMLDRNELKRGGER